jgi:hypothetical protein
MQSTDEPMTLEKLENVNTLNEQNGGPTESKQKKSSHRMFLDDMEYSS